MKKVFPIIVALLLAAVASWGILNWSRNLTTGNKYKPYVAAQHLLPVGQIITEKDMATGEVPYPVISTQNQGVWDFVFQSFVTPDNRNTLVNRVVAREIQEGFPILDRDLKPVERETHRVDWKATKIPEKTRAIAIPVNGNRAVNGLVEVGDHVDVLVTLRVPSKSGEEPQTITVPVQMGNTTQNVKVPAGGPSAQGEPMTFYLLQDVEVLTVGSKTFRMDEIDENDPMAMLAAQQVGGSSGAITVALSPEKALLVAFANSGGSAEFTLVLRTPGDKELYDTVNKPAAANYKELLLNVGAKP